MSNELQDKPDTSKRPSFGTGVIFLVAAAVIKIIGMVMAASAVGSARSSGSFFGAGSHLQRAANISGTTEVLMVLFGLIGIVLLIRAAVKRSGNQSRTP